MCRWITACGKACRIRFSSVWIHHRILLFLWFVQYFHPPLSSRSTVTDSIRFVFVIIMGWAPSRLIWKIRAVCLTSGPSISMIVELKMFWRLTRVLSDYMIRPSFALSSRYTPSFTIAVRGTVAFSAFMAAIYPSFLQHQARELTISSSIVKATNPCDITVLGPDKVGALKSLPIAFGFGDGHGGNLVVSSAGSPPSMLYMDYEVAGHHTRFLDLAKSISQDGFLNIAYADVWYGDLTTRSRHKKSL